MRGFPATDAPIAALAAPQHGVLSRSRARRLIVEVDGYGFHRSPSKFEDDRERDVMLGLAGWTVLRFTWTQVTTRPRWVAAAVGARLGGPRAPSTRPSST